MSVEQLADAETGRTSASSRLRATSRGGVESCPPPSGDLPEIAAVGQNALMASTPAYVYDLLGEPRRLRRGATRCSRTSPPRARRARSRTRSCCCEHPPTLTLGRSTDDEQELPLGRDGVRGARLGRLRDRPRRPLDLPRPRPARRLPDPRPARARQGPAPLRARPRARAGAGARRTSASRRTTREGAENVGVWVGERKIASLGDPRPRLDRDATASR